MAKQKTPGTGGKSERVEEETGTPLQWSEALKTPIVPPGLSGEMQREWDEYVQLHEELSREMVPPPPKDVPPIRTKSQYEHVLSAHPLTALSRGECNPWEQVASAVTFAELVAFEIEKRALAPLETWEGPPASQDQAIAFVDAIAAWLNNTLEAIGYDGEDRNGKGLLALFDITDPGEGFLRTFDPPPPTELLPMLNWILAFTGPADFLGPLPPQLFSNELPARLSRNLEATRTWVESIGEPKDVHPSEWFEIHAKLINLWMAGRIFAMNCSGWVVETVAAFRNANIPALIFPVEGNEIKVAVCGRTRPVDMASYEPELRRLASGEQVKMSRVAKHRMLERLPWLAPFIRTARKKGKAKAKSARKDTGVDDAKYLLDKEVVERAIFPEKS